MVGREPSSLTLGLHNLIRHAMAGCVDPVDADEAAYTFVEALCEQAGYMVGQYTSDHALGPCLRKFVQAAEAALAGTAPVVPLPGWQLRHLRIEAGLAQHELASRLGIHQTTLSSWECGGNVRMSNAQLLAAWAALPIPSHPSYFATTPKGPNDE